MGASLATMSLGAYITPILRGGVMRDQISQAIKDAMKGGDKRRLATLRLISAAIKDRDIAAQVDSAGEPTGTDKISDAEVLQLLQKMVKQRRESADTYRQAGRQDLADLDMSVIDHIEDILPTQIYEV